MKQSICITIRGHVQGVGFRYHALNQANEFEINGFVKNQPDGSVFIEAEGEAESVDLFLEWCRQGPRWANIETVEIKPIESRNYNGFTIK